MNIWDDIVITWEGQEYTVRPTIEFINSLERGAGRSLSKLLIRLYDSDLPSGIASEIIAKTLNAGGLKITTEEIFLATSGLGEEVVTMVATIINACLPNRKGGSEEKKTE